MSQNLSIDAADPNSLAMMLPDQLAEQAKALPIELLTQDEITLTTLVNPTEQQQRLKIQFWDEYELAIKNHRQMLVSNITFGVCTKEYLEEFCIAKRNVAWLISPRASYKIRIAELLDRGLKVISDIFDMDAEGKNAVNVRTLQLAALRMLDMRKHGGYTQRSEQKVLLKDITTPEESNAALDSKLPLGEGSVQDLEAQVRGLEDKIRVGKNQNGSLLNARYGKEPDTIDVTPPGKGT